MVPSGYQTHGKMTNSTSTAQYRGGNGTRKEKNTTRRGRRHKDFEKPTIDAMLAQMDSDVNTWGLPQVIRQVFRERGVADWYPWQKELLNKPSVLEVRSNMRLLGIHSNCVCNKGK
jgi:hypothetical protein